MKKIFSIFLLLILALGLTACGNNDNNNNNSNPPNNYVGGNVLITYFSCTDTTEAIAKHIQTKTKGTLFKIEAKVPYTADDLKYYTNSRADQEQNNQNARPEIANQVFNFDKYDIIFLGYPIWHSQAPKIIYTFLESYDFSGKTIVPFCTSHSSGLGNSASNLHLLASGAEWKEGRRFAAGTEYNTISDWVDSMNLKFVRDVSTFDLESGVNGKAPTVLLNSGYEMPILGLGTYSLQGETCKNSVKSALASGVRLIDTAYMYGNEREIGEAINEVIAEGQIKREDIFVITKLYPGLQYSNPEQAIQEAFDKLNIEYIDMMLLHHPGTNDVKAYKSMEKAVERGEIRSLGLSNWYIEEIDDFISKVTIMPALIQNEIHPFYQEKTVVPYMHNLGIVMQAWYPFGGRGYTSVLLNNSTITQIASAHNVSSAQVILRWHLQRGVVAIPGSSNPSHILEDISVFDFSLTDSEMQQIANLDRNEKHDWY